MKTLPFAGFKIKLLTSPLIPKTTIYAFTSPHHAKTLVTILESIDKLIRADRLRLSLIRKPKERIIKPS